MSSSTLPEAAEAFGKLAEIVYRGGTYAEIYDAICQAAVAAVPGCDHACVSTMSTGERSVCEAATDEAARTLDDLEWETQEGPCLEAMLSSSFACDPDITTNATWPKLAERVVASTPIRGMVGYRIRVGDRRAGALNLLSDTPGALTDESAAMGAIVASFASVALAAAEQRAAATTLREALDSNREIGKAIGLLMATHDVTDEAAFEMLRTASSQLNVRLAEVARRVVEGSNGDKDRRVD